MTRTCPNCRYPMVTEQHHNLDLDLCRNCAGIWFDASELSHLITAESSSLAALEARVAPRMTQYKMQPGICTCPSCNSLLRMYHFQYDSPVELHVCDDCGGCWVQEGELEKMQQWRDQRPNADSRASAKPQDTPPRVRIHIGAHQDHASLRLENIRRFCDALRQHKPLGNRPSGK